MVIKNIVLGRAGPLQFLATGTECYKTALKVSAEVLITIIKLDTMLKEYLLNACEVCVFLLNPSH